jgi:hypothetical protein
VGEFNADYRPGWLSFLGIGVTDEKTVKTTVTHTGSTEQTSTEEAKVSVEFYAQIDEVYAVEVYYDRAFGTFAFRQVPVNSQPIFSSIATDPSGHPISGALVSLMTGNQKFTTRTDAQGRYAFRAATLKPGRGTLLLGNQRREIQIPAKPSPTLGPNRIR